MGAAECGSHRASRYVCPAECPFNPWAPSNYALGLSIDERLSEKLSKQLSAWGSHNYGLDVDLLRRKDGLTAHAMMMSAVQYTRHRDGRTFAERWEAEGYPGLNNDESFLFSRIQAGRMAVIEIRRVLGPEECEATDLLDASPEPFVIHDRSLAGQAVRFTSLMGWLFALPHYRRIYGVAGSIPDVNQRDARDVVLETARHLGAPEDDAARRAWLGPNFRRMMDSFKSTQHVLRHRLFQSMDARFTRTTYDWSGSEAAFASRMDRLDCAIREKPSQGDWREGVVASWAWLDVPAPTNPREPELPFPEACRAPVGRPLLGRVLQKPGVVCIEAGSAERHAALKAIFEKKFSGKLVFREERVDDLGTRAAGQGIPAGDEALVPPAFLENASRVITQVSMVDKPPDARSQQDLIAETRRKNLEHFLDDSIPWLDGLTPRQAAIRPEMRPRLVSLMKKHVRWHDEWARENRRETDDINWVLKELGLHELDVPPPPLPADEPAVEEGEPEEGEADGEPVSPVERVFSRFASKVEIVEAFQAEAPEVYEYVLSVTQEDWSNEEAGRFLFFTALTWHAVGPTPIQAEKVNLDYLGMTFAANLDRLLKGVTKVGHPDAWLKGCRRPDLLAEISSLWTDPEDASTTRGPIIVFGVCFFRVLLDELDRVVSDG